MKREQAAQILIDLAHTFNAKTVEAIELQRYAQAKAFAGASDAVADELGKLMSGAKVSEIVTQGSEIVRLFRDGTIKESNET